MSAWPEVIVLALGAYFALGACFAVAFLALGVQAVDPAGADMPMTARLLILPGAAALWPLLAVKWVRSPSQPTQ